MRHSGFLPSSSLSTKTLLHAFLAWRFDSYVDNDLRLGKSFIRYLESVTSLTHLEKPPKVRCLGTSPGGAVWTPFSRKYTTKVHCSCEALAIVQSSLQASFDIIILCLPIPIFLKLKLSSGKRGKQALPFSPLLPPT